MATDTVLFIDGQVAFDASGNVRFVDTASPGDCECCGCVTDCTALAACYQIAGYVDGDFTPCGTCDPVASFPPGNNAGPWDGTFYDAPPNTMSSPANDCVFREDYIGPGPGGLGYLTAGDSALYSAELSGDGSCNWFIIIYCGHLGIVETPVLLWSGSMSGSATPVGTYTRTGGCDSTATLDIEEC